MSKFVYGSGDFVLNKWSCEGKITNIKSIPAKINQENLCKIMKMVKQMSIGTKQTM